MTLILIGVIYCPRPMHMRSIKQTSQLVAKLLIGMIFTLSVIVTLTFDLVISISIAVIYCPRPKQMRSIKTISLFSDELLIGNHFV